MRDFARDGQKTDLAPRRRVWSDTALPRLQDRADLVLHLQNTIGNQAVQRLLRLGHSAPPAGARSNLIVSPPEDGYERKADRMAEVMAHPARDGATPHLHRVGEQPAGQMDLAPASVEDAIADPGRPLEPALLQDMEQRFGHDFSEVRIHTGPAAERSAQDLTARAYTVGQEIVFDARAFAPHSHEGRRLIAHELTHVVQQSGARAAAGGHVTTRRVQRQPAPPAGGGQTKPGPEAHDPAAFFNRMLSDPNYIDNNIKKVSFYTAELAIIEYHDGSTFELGLVPKWMKPPVVEVDYHTPRADYRQRYDPKGELSFFLESELQGIPRTMTWSEVQKRYTHPVDFYADGKSGRIVPSRINMLTAPTLCRVLLDSEVKFVKQSEWAAEWGTEVAGVVSVMGAGGFHGRVAETGLVEAGVAKLAGSRAMKKLAEKLTDLLKAGGTKSITVEGVLFEDVQLARQGSTLAVRRFRIARVAAPPGQGSLVSEAFEDAAVSVARANGLKTVTINVGVIVNPGWREWLESLGYVYNQAEGGWIKTIILRQ
jgi:hypothetical protein